MSEQNFCSILNLCVDAVNTALFRIVGVDSMETRWVLRWLELNPLGKLIFEQQCQTQIQFIFISDLNRVRTMPSVESTQDDEREGINGKILMKQ